MLLHKSVGILFLSDDFSRLVKVYYAQHTRFIGHEFPIIPAFPVRVEL